MPNRARQSPPDNPVMITDKQHSEVRWLIQEAEDPFAMFPIQSVARRLSELLSDAQEDFGSRQGEWGVARRYWDVESEHLHAECGYLLGATFVLGQAALTQTVSIISKLHSLNDALPSIPKSREQLLNIEAPINRES